MSQADEQEKFEKEKLRIESGLPLEEEPEVIEPKVKSTIHVPSKEDEFAADGSERHTFLS